MILAMIGAGKMGEALARGILKTGLIALPDILFADISRERLEFLASELGIAAAADNASAVKDADVVVLAIKPKDIDQVCREIGSALKPQATVLSIVTGVTLDQLRQKLGRGDIVLARAMPNVPCLVGAGAIGISYPAEAPAKSRTLLAQLLAETGLVQEMPESLLNAVTGLSGSGPAFVALFIEALADGGVLMGLPRNDALNLATQTVYGAARLIAETGQHPALLKDAVSTPAGTTIAGLEALEQAGFRAATIAAVKAATMRARALSGE